MAEFPGTTSPCTGNVLTVGAGAFDWYLEGGTNEDLPTLELFTTNMLNYLRASCTTPVFEPVKNDLTVVAYPNPVSDMLSLAFTLEKNAAVTVEITDVAGRRVAVLAQHQTMSEGTQTIRWSTVGHPDGLYFYKIVAGNKTGTGKVFLSTN